MSISDLLICSSHLCLFGCCCCCFLSSTASFGSDDHFISERERAINNLHCAQVKVVEQQPLLTHKERPNEDEARANGARRAFNRNAQTQIHGDSEIKNICDIFSRQQRSRSRS